MFSKILKHTLVVVARCCHQGCASRAVSPVWGSQESRKGEDEGKDEGDDEGEEEGERRLKWTRKIRDHSEGKIPSLCLLPCPTLQLHQSLQTPGR